MRERKKIILEKREKKMKKEKEKRKKYVEFY